MENPTTFYFSPENIGNRFAYRKLKIRSAMDMSEKRNETVKKVDEFLKNPIVSSMSIRFSIEDLPCSYVVQFMK